MEDRLSLQPEPSDELLAARVAQGDVKAFALLYDRHARPVYTMTAHMLGQFEAEEIVQEVFLRLWHKADRFDAGRGSFKNWFMAVARYRVLDELRRRSQRQRYMAAEEIDQLLTQVHDPGVDVEREVWQREDGRVVLRALNTLPPEQRRVLVLAYFGGLSQSAIAQHLDWPLGTVKKRVRLGLQKLRTLLSSQEPALEDRPISHDA